MAERLYSTAGVARELGVSFGAVRGRWERGNAPEAEFCCVMNDGREVPMWTDLGLELWRALVRDPEGRLPKKRSLGIDPMPEDFSDHNAVNQVGSISVTWRLWWTRNEANNPPVTVWWFSTPNGWYTSDNHGRRWTYTGLMRRPAGSYRPLNAPSRVGMPAGAVIVHHAAQALQRRIESNTAQGAEATA